MKKMNVKIFFALAVHALNTCMYSTSINRSIFQAEFSTNTSYHYYMVLFFKNFLIIVKLIYTLYFIFYSIIQYLRLIHDLFSIN